MGPGAAAGVGCPEEGAGAGAGTGPTARGDRLSLTAEYFRLSSSGVGRVAAGAAWTWGLCGAGAGAAWVAAAGFAAAVFCGLAGFRLPGRDGFWGLGVKGTGSRPGDGGWLTSRMPMVVGNGAGSACPMSGTAMLRAVASARLSNNGRGMFMFVSPGPGFP